MKGKDYIVSLDIVTSSSMTASQLLEQLGLKKPKKSEFTYKKIKGGKLWWSYEPALDESMTLGNRIQFIASRICAEKPIQLNKNIRDIYLRIGVFYDVTMWATSGVYLHPKCMNLLLKKIPEISVDIRCYPCVDGDTPVQLKIEKSLI